MALVLKKTTLDREKTARFPEIEAYINQQLQEADAAIAAEHAEDVQDGVAMEFA